MTAVTAAAVGWAPAYNTACTFSGSGGGNTWTGSGANETAFGNGGNDSLLGNGGADVLNGGDGNDTLNGGDGNDRLIGGPGSDSLIGGTGTDVADYSAENGKPHGQRWRRQRCRAGTRRAMSCPASKA